MDAQQFTILQASEESIKKFDFQVNDKQKLFQLINDTFKKPSKTAKEKFETLVLRDKILKLIRHELYQISPSSSGEVIEGSCMDMCPEKERFSRECLGLCHKYEYSAENEQPDQYLMIKEYSRSSADQDLPLPNEMRPLDVLHDTMLYIIDRIITKLEELSTERDFVHNQDLFSIVEWYDFVWNRTRSIRKEIIQQRLLTSESDPNLKGVSIIEQCARFHIMCAHRLCDQPSDIFDFKINEENLKNCFQSLRQYYQTSHELGSNLIPSPNEAEFKSYIILLNLTESNILGEIQRWPKEIRHSRNVHFALDCYFAFNSKNYVKFFRLITSDECQYLQSCILHRHFFSVRLNAFKTIFTSFKENKEKVYPIDKIVEILGFNDTEEASQYAYVLGMELTDDRLSFKMPPYRSTTIFELNKTDQDSLRLRRSKIVEDKFYIDHFFSNDLHNCDRLAVIISGMEIEEVKSSRFLSAHHKINTSFDIEGYFVSLEIENHLDELRIAKEQQSVLKPLQNTQVNKFIENPFAEIKKPERSKTSLSQDLKFEELVQSKKVSNFFPSLPNSKPNLFESIIKKKTAPTTFASESAVVAPKIVVDMSKIAENINTEIIEEKTYSIIKELISNYINVSMDISSFYLDLMVKENIQNCLIEELLHQQNLKYKNEAFNRISVEIGEEILNQVIKNFCSDYFKKLITYENIIFDEILTSVFQSQFDFVLKQIAIEISKDIFLDKLATRIYFDPENGLFNQDLLLTLHNTIFEQTRLSLNVNMELYSEIQSSIEENYKRNIFQKWRLRLSIKLLKKQHRRSLNPNVSFLLKYAAFLTKNFSKLSWMKFYLYKTVHCGSFIDHMSFLPINLNQIFNNILLENYFNIINNNTSEILIDLPKPIQEVNINTVFFCRRDDILKKIFISQSSILENIAINLLDPREFGVKFCLKKYHSIQDLSRANSIIYTIETFDQSELINLKNFKHILFISLFPREKTYEFINRVLGNRDRILLCCPKEDKNFFTIDQMFETFMRQILADESNRSPNLITVNLKDLLFETLIKFLDNSKNLMIDQCLHEFSQRYWRLIDILVDKKSECQNAWPILEFIPKEQETLKFWGCAELDQFLRVTMWNLFSAEVDNKKTENYRALIVFKIENEKLLLGNCEYNIGEIFVFADMDLIRGIDWVGKEELSRKYSFGNMKRRISAEKKAVVVEKEKEEKSPKRLMLINEKVKNIVEEKLKPIDTNFDDFLSQFQKEKENTEKFESKLADLVSNNKVEESESTVSSTFDDFMKKLNDEKMSNDKFNQKLDKILWKY